MQLVWMENVKGDLEGTVAVSLESDAPQMSGGHTYKHYSIFFTKASRSLIAVPSEVVPLVLMIGPGSFDLKQRSVKTGGLAPDCGNQWKIAEKQKQPKAVRDGTWIEIDGKRVA